MAHIAILTNAFPYYPGEQFLEEEIIYWGKDATNKIVVLPRSRSGEFRKIPDNISVKNHLLTSSKIRKIFWAFRSLFSAIFFIELGFMLAEKKNIFRGFSQVLRATLNTLLLSHGLDRYIRENGEIDVVYSYWNEVAAYAACIEKRRGRVRHVISRAHGHDLYEYRRIGHYMPLKRQFVGDFDAVYFLSEEGRSYFLNTYGASPHCLYISPLGIRVPQENSKNGLPNKISIVSVSYCVPIKRIDKIMKAVCNFSVRHNSLEVAWTHIGSGELFLSLAEEGERLEKANGNLKINFIGEIPNSGVRDFFAKNPVDVFVNASDSEGMPVSIMEAMASGVPVVAPDVGGIAYLVNASTGCLINRNPSVDDILDGLEKIVFSPNIDELRRNSKKLINSEFNSKINYPNFVSNICLLAANDEFCADY